MQKFAGEIFKRMSTNYLPKKFLEKLGKISHNFGEIELRS
jgi:hypothetical protein